MVDEVVVERGLVDGDHQMTKRLQIKMVEVETRESRDTKTS